ncbi:hypothetical protein BJ978_001423 [Agromyces terreus]|uniref:Lipoprotein n=1 Tax=Agromyces terreus TaxID=424795 RepID=A0A9X2GY39_9MICO|nr:hypothetical protein [Agromyces terreus]MCP2370747.1 hypothetical protein [Agromyces terreus]
MNRRNWTRKALVLASVLVCGTLLSGCSGWTDADAATPPGAAVDTNAGTQPSGDAVPMMPEADEAHLCGQVSALEGIRYRSDWEHAQGLIDNAAYASRVAAVEDGWKYMVLGSTDVSPAIKDAQQAVASGGIGYENTDFQRAVGDVAGACDAAGSLVSVSALPGQGG